MPEFLNKVAGLRPAILLNKRPQGKSAFVWMNFVKYLRTTFFARDCFSKSLCMSMTVAGYICKVVLKIFGKYPGPYMHWIAVNQSEFIHVNKYT